MVIVCLGLGLKRDPKMVPLNRSGYAVSPFGGRPKRDPKMVPLNRPGHAVSPFGGRLFGARPEWFWYVLV